MASRKLFTSQPPPNFNSSFTSSKSAPSLTWSTNNVELSMRKGVRKQLKSQQMKEQVKTYLTIQKEIVIKKAIYLTVISSAVFYILNIQAPTIFTFFMLLATEIACNTTLPFTDLQLMIRKVQPIIYCSIFYSLFKWGVGITSREFSWSIITISIITTLAHSILKIYKPFLSILTRKIAAEAISQKTINTKINNFCQYEILKFGMILRLSKHLIITLGVFFTLLALVFTYFGKFTVQVFQLNYIFVSFILFCFIQVYLDLVDYMNLALGQSTKLMKLIKDQMPIFVNLLRLEHKPNNHSIQLDCLKYVYIKGIQVQSFLTTQTCKSLLYTTYMDIFNQYAQGELERTNKIINELVISIKTNEKIIIQHKTLLQDLFVYFKKLIAFVSSEWCVIQILDLMSSNDFMFLILKQIHLSIQSQAQLSKKVASLSKAVIVRIDECSSNLGLSSFSRNQLKKVHQQLVSDQ